MNFLKRIFGSSSEKDNALYFYVQPRGCDEIVRVRINPQNDLSQSDDLTTYFVRKIVRGTKCFNQVEMELYFDSNRRLADSQLQGGKLVTQAEYEQWLTTQGMPGA